MNQWGKRKVINAHTDQLIIETPTSARMPWLWDVFFWIMTLQTVKYADQFSSMTDHKEQIRENHYNNKQSSFFWYLNKTLWFSDAKRMFLLIWWLMHQQMSDRQTDLNTSSGIGPILFYSDVLLTTKVTTLSIADQLAFFSSMFEYNILVLTMPIHIATKEAIKNQYQGF